MNRDEVMDKVREHLAAELGVDAAEIEDGDPLSRRPRRRLARPLRARDGAGGHLRRSRSPRRKRRGSRRSAEAVDFVVEHVPRAPAQGSEAMARGRRRSARADRRVARGAAPQALTHSSWAERSRRVLWAARLPRGQRSRARGRRGAVPPLSRSDIGRLTKVHGQAVSGRACAEVADGAGRGRDARRRRAAGHRGGDRRRGAAVVGARNGLGRRGADRRLLLENGYERVAAATVAAFEPEIELASETLLDFKSALQEGLARGGASVSYAVVDETGPAHDRHFDVEASVSDEVIGQGSGRSKKAAEQAAARQALERLTG